MASGWMQIRARAKQRNAELPLIISDHCDWPELLQTIEEVNPKEVWVTHGREDALMYQAEKMGFKLGALSLVGYDEEEQRRRLMKAFSNLLEQLYYTSGNKAKAQLIADYIANTPDPDRGWAIAAMAGTLRFDFFKRNTVKKLITGTH